MSAPSVSGNCAFRSPTGIGVPPAPVSAPITSPSAAPADAGSPDFCAASMLARAASMRLAAAVIASVSTFTSPPGVFRLKLLPGRAPPIEKAPNPKNNAEIDPMTTHITIARMITTAA